METITLYHGSEQEIANFLPAVIYASSVREDAEQYNFGSGHLYAVEIPVSHIEEEEDFDNLDCGGYQNPEAWSLPVVGHKESGYHFIKNAAAYVWRKIA